MSATLVALLDVMIWTRQPDYGEPTRTILGVALLFVLAVYAILWLSLRGVYVPGFWVKDKP